MDQLPKYDNIYINVLMLEKQNSNLPTSVGIYSTLNSFVPCSILYGTEDPLGAEI
jgi:hypothetical protein